MEVATRYAKVIAPVLRGLWADADGRVPLVSVAGVDQSGGKADVTCELTCDPDDTATVVAEMRKALGENSEKVTSVFVRDVGLFVKKPNPIVTGRVAGRTALVTGAAQGVGKHIATDLAEQGAHVALADVKVEGVQDVCSELNARFGDERTRGLAMDVTDDASVADGIGHLVQSWGGIDLLVANAGVLKADSVKRLPVEDFRFVTDVNYTGYFVSVRNVSPVMAAQFAANPKQWLDIVQVNSKSGLSGSNRNPAYAGSKFGGIGLTQSFAMELVEDGIKVNSICPGNFLDSPLWSDPDNGLFVQYLRAGKVPGATTIEDVRRAYEAKVPMGRGCRPEDAMKAIYYLVEQNYETGQALPVTGGQEMLR